MNQKRLTEMIGQIESVHAIVCDKHKEMDRAGDVIVSVKIDGKWYEILRLTERCNYFAGSTTRAGLASDLIKKKARSAPPHSGDNWNPDINL